MLIQREKQDECFISNGMENQSYTLKQEITFIIHETNNNINTYTSKWVLRIKYNTL